MYINDPNDTNNPKLRLTLRLSRGAMSFSVGDPRADGQIVFEPYAENGGISTAANLRNAFGESELLQSGYKNALVVVDSPVVLVPSDEYDERQAPLLYRYTVSGHDKDDIARAEMTELGSTAVFAINHDVRTVIADHFENVNFLPLVQPVWHHLYHKAFTGSRQKLFAYFHDKKINVFRFERGRFRFANCYDCSHAHDALYYILYVWKLLGMSNEDDELYIAGEVMHSEWFIENVEHHLRRCFTIDAAAEFNQNDMAKRAEIPYDLKALYLG